MFFLRNESPSPDDLWMVIMPSHSKLSCSAPKALQPYVGGLYAYVYICLFVRRFFIHNKHQKKVSRLNAAKELLNGN